MKIAKQTLVDIPLRNFADIQRVIQQRVATTEVSEIKTPADVARLVKLLSSVPVPFAVAVVRPR